MKIRAVLFDAYGTLFDVHSVALLAEQLFPGCGDKLSVLWRDKQIEYTRLITMSAAPGDEARHYLPFWDITRASLRCAAARLGLTLLPAAEEQLMNQYRHLSAFAENHEVLKTLKRRGVSTGILSNGDPGMLGVAVKSAGFADLLQHVISVHSVRRYKTDPAAYALGPATLGLPAREILFVSSNAWDAIGATWFGYTTLWVNRSGAAPEQLGTEPTFTGRSLRDVLDHFPASAQPTRPTRST
ncbi:MAG: haloacid dehalogenase type II [Rubrivivax sp.]|nr:haloacid dehalogenase type II [Rubrivivax sp.]MDP3611724.1 haloacid dehalogenase type II [Rubrivivax sp.]